MLLSQDEFPEEQCSVIDHAVLWSATKEAPAASSRKETLQGSSGD